MTLKKYAFILVAVAFLFLLQSVSATQPTIPTLKMNMELSFPIALELNKEFPVVFTFTPLEEVPHKNELTDEAKITFDSGIELVTGQPVFEGRLKKGESHTIQLVLKSVTEGLHSISGYVRSCQIEPRFIGEDPDLERKTGMKYFGKAFEYHNGVKKHFKIGEVDSRMEIPVTDLKTGKTTRIKAVDGFALPPITQQFRIAKGPVLKDSSETLDKLRILTPKHQEYAIPFQKTEDRSDSMQVFYVSDINLGKEDSAIIFLYDEDNEEVVKAVWRCEPGGSCKIKILTNSKITVISLTQEEFIVVGTYEGWEYKVKVSNINPSIQNTE